MSFISEVIFSHKPDEETRNTSAYDFSFKNIKNGDDLNLSDYKNKLIIIVNTASECMFTKQYNDLQKVYDQYRYRGLVIIAVPSNDFGKQEPDSNNNIKKFCRTNFGTEFPITEKTIVSGDNAHGFYKWAGKYLGQSSKPKWNFYKYIITPDGELIDFLLPFTKITSKKAIHIIENNLPRN